MLSTSPKPPQMSVYTLCVKYISSHIFLFQSFLFFPAANSAMQLWTGSYCCFHIIRMINYFPFVESNPIFGYTLILPKERQNKNQVNLLVLHYLQFEISGGKKNNLELYIMNTSSVISVAIDLPISWYCWPFPSGPKRINKNLQKRQKQNILRMKSWNSLM